MSKNTDRTPTEYTEAEKVKLRDVGFTDEEIRQMQVMCVPFAFVLSHPSPVEEWRKFVQLSKKVFDDLMKETRSICQRHGLYPTKEDTTLN